MPRLKWFLWVLLVVAFVGLPLATVLTAQTRIEFVPARPVAGVEGAKLYEAYCATCHGRTGLGDGPAARLLDEPVPNLTIIVVRDGKFDESHVVAHISGDPMHAGMESWPRVLASANRMAPEMLMVNNLCRHIKSLQVQSASR